MGGTTSTNRRRQNDTNNNYAQNPPPSSHQLYPGTSSSSSSSFSSTHSRPPQNSNHAHQNYLHNYSSNTNHTPPPPPPPPPHNPYPSHPPPPHNTYPNHPPPPPPMMNYSFYNYSNGYNHNPSCNYGNQGMGGGSNYPPYYVNNHVGYGWGNVRPATIVGPVQQPVNPAPYVEHQNAKKVRNDVNVHKDTLRIEVDEQNPDHILVSFVFDAVYDGSITLYYFSKEEPGCKFVPLFPEVYMPLRIPFHKGPGQKFRQPSGTGVDLGFFELDDLAKPSPEEDVFPLVIAAETWLPDATNKSPNMQITQAVLEKSNSDPFRAKVIRQLLWVDEVRYELREIYGIGSSTSQDYDDSEPGKECVICMTDPKDTAVLPCRHMCMCSECAKELRLRSDKCPICRQPIEELIEIKINN